LQVEVSTRHTSSQFSCLVIDGSAVLYTIHWPANGTVGDFICNFKTYVGQKLKQGEVFLVFDHYRQYSTKGVTRSGRQSNASKVYQLTHDTLLPPQNVALGVTENKKQTRGPRGPWVAHLRIRSNFTVEPILENPRGII